MDTENVAAAARYHHTNVTSGNILHTFSIDTQHFNVQPQELV